MCLLIGELIMLIGGLYALIVGRVTLTRNISLEGWRARLAGIFLIAPFPLAFLAQVLIVYFMRTGILPRPRSLDYAFYVEPLLVLGGLVGVVVYGLSVKPKEQVTLGAGEEALEDKTMPTTIQSTENVPNAGATATTGAGKISVYKRYSPSESSFSVVEVPHSDGPSTFFVGTPSEEKVSFQCPWCGQNYEISSSGENGMLNCVQCGQTMLLTRI